MSTLGANFICKHTKYPLCKVADLAHANRKLGIVEIIFGLFAPERLPGSGIKRCARSPAFHFHGYTKLAKGEVHQVSEIIVVLLNN